MPAVTLWPVSTVADLMKRLLRKTQYDIICGYSLSSVFMLSQFLILEMSCLKFMASEFQLDERTRSSTQLKLVFWDGCKSFGKGGRLGEGIEGGGQGRGGGRRRRERKRKGRGRGG